MTDPTPVLLVLGPLAGAFLALAALYAGRGGTAPAPIRLVAHGTVAELWPTSWRVDSWQTPGPQRHRLGTLMQSPHPGIDRTGVQEASRGSAAAPPWRRNPLASTWPDPPPAAHTHQTTALTTSVARAWDQQGYDW